MNKIVVGCWFFLEFLKLTICPSFAPFSSSANQKRCCRLKLVGNIAYPGLYSQALFLGPIFRIPQRVDFFQALADWAGVPGLVALWPVMS